MGAPQPAEKLGERYAIYGEIASGGMASVHFARLAGAVGFTRTVAIKRLHANLRVQEEFVQMFLDEARLAARVRHPNVVATIDVVETADHIGLVMEYVHGESLRRLARRVMAQGGRVPRRIAAAIMVGALHGLHAAHEAKNEQGELLNLVHRDVSPHNIIVGADGIPRVIDFGIAKARGQLPDTTAGAIKGKFAYMAPEQLNAGIITRAADIYSASIVLWELLTGRRLFDSKMDASLLERANAKIERPSSIVPSLTPALDGLVLRGLSGDPEKRFTSAREMARAIEDCIAPASTADVGEWVERMAKDRLDQREAVLAEIEGRTSSQVPELVLPTAPAPKTAPPETLGAYATHTPSSSAVVPASHLTSEPDTEEMAGPAIEIDQFPVAGQGGLPARSIFPSARPKASEPPSRRFRGGLSLPLAAIVLIGALGFAACEAPSYAETRLVDAAAQRGLSLSVADLAIRPGALAMKDPHVELSHLDGVTLAVSDVEVALHGLSVGEVRVQGFELTAQGALGDVLGSVSRWGSSQIAPLYFEARSGHIVWNDVFGKATALEAWDVTLSSAKGRLLVSSPSVLIRTAHSKLGPWTLKLERSEPSSTLWVALDPSNANPAVVLSWGAAQRSATIDLVRTPLSKLGIPPSALGLLNDVEVAGRSSVVESPDAKAEGQLDLSWFGAGADAQVTGRFSGDSLAALTLVDGQVVAGAARGTLGGTLSLSDSGLHLELTVHGAGRSLPPSAAFDSRVLGDRL